MKSYVAHAIAAWIAWRPAAALDRAFYGLDYDARMSSAGGCKDEADVRLDFRAMAAVTSNVRIDTMGEPCVERILGVAAEHNMRVWLGLTGDIDAGLDAFERDFAIFQRLVKEKKVRNDNVLGVGVASEAIYRYYIQGRRDFAQRDGSDKLIAYAARARDFVRANGLNFPVTISDVMDAYKYSANLYDAETTSTAS